MDANSRHKNRITIAMTRDTVQGTIKAAGGTTPVSNPVSVASILQGIIPLQLAWPGRIG